MQARCGAWQVGNDIDRGRIEFRVFFPTGPAPEIDAIRVAGDFQQALGDNNWDFAGGLPLTQDTSDPRGSFWTAQTNLEVPAGFYQYKYLVTFNDRTTRIVSDPCTPLRRPQRPERGSRDRGQPARPEHRAAVGIRPEAAGRPERVRTDDR